MAAVSLNTLRALFRTPATKKTMPHACRAVNDVISSSMLAGETGRHAGGELGKCSKSVQSRAEVYVTKACDTCTDICQL